MKASGDQGTNEQVGKGMEGSPSSGQSDATDRGRSGGRRAAAPGRLARASQKALGWLVAHGWYRTRLHGSVPAEGPAILVSLHRAGAVDGWVQWGAIGGDVTFLVGANLRRNPLARLLAVGIPVERAKDAGDRSGNLQALEVAADWVARGGRLLVYPEGTSTLGPAQLPFHAGAARIAGLVLERGVTPAIVPLGIDYARPGMPGTAVDVTAGAPLVLEGAAGPMAPRAIHGRIEAALGGMALRFPSAAAQARARYAASRLAGMDGAERLALLRGPPPAALPPQRAASKAAVLGFWLGALANAPLALLAWWVPRKMADDANVVPFWQLVPLAFAAPAWIAACGALAWLELGPVGLADPALQVGLGFLALRCTPRAFPEAPPSGNAGDDLDAAARPVEADDVAVAERR